MKKIVIYCCVLMLTFMPIIHKNALGKSVQSEYQTDNQASYHAGTVEPYCITGNQQPPVRD